MRPTGPRSSKPLLKALGTLGLSLLFRWLRSSSRRPGAPSAHPQKPRAKPRTSGDRFAEAPGGAPAGSAPARATKAKSRAAPAPGPEAVLALVRARAQGEWVTARLRVLKVLADDHEGSRHQRLLVKVGQDPRGNDFTVKVSHNIDLAPRVPIREGEEFSVRGEFVWNDLGGAIHWTHHDPEGRHEGGWIEYGGKTYR